MQKKVEQINEGRALNFAIMQLIKSKKLQSFLTSFNFTKGLLIAIAAFSAVAFCAYFFSVPIASIVATGILLTSLTDIPGTRKQQLSAMSIALALAIADSIVMKFAIQNQFLLLPVLTILIFANAYLAIYGFRASLVSFAGLLAVIVSFTRVHTGIEIFYYSFYLLCGGCWYILLQFIFGRYRTYSHIEQLLAECMHLSAVYLQAKSTHLNAENRKQVAAKILALQNELILKHDEIRNLLLVLDKQEILTAGNNRSLLIFIELVNVLELAIATPLRSATDPDDNIHFSSAIKITEELLKKIGDNYEAISLGDKTIHGVHELKSLTGAAEEQRNLFGANTINTIKDAPALQKLRTLKQFSLQQVEKQLTISRLVHNEQDTDIKIDSDRNKKFLTIQSYSPWLLVQNLNFSFPIFRHCLRLTITMIIGYLIGIAFAVQNPYWIMLTIMVIMRPGYILTKQRTIYRTVGTIAGALVSVGIVLLTQNFVIYAVIIFISTTLAFSLTQQNYRAAAFFITVMLLLIYAMITQDAFKLMQFRVLDTVIGAILSSAANYFFWPAWEIKGFEKLLLASLQANQLYYQEVTALLTPKGTNETSNYRVARKKSFLAMGELHAGMERISQEPVSKRKDLSWLEKMVWLQQDILAAIAALSTDIQISKNHTVDINMVEEINVTNNAQELSISTLNKYLRLKKELVEEPEILNVPYPSADDTVSRSIKNDLTALKILCERVHTVIEVKYGKQIV